MGNTQKNTIHYISSSVGYIAEQNGWIEGNAVDQLGTTAKLSGMQKVMGMPDLHAGRGYPVGAAFLTKGRIYPALIGNDIGCGMRFWQTNLKQHTLKLDKLERKIRQYSDIADTQWLRSVLTDEELKHPFAKSLGSIGSGNHFSELQKIVEVIDENVFADFGLDRSKAFLLVHSGSRGLGESILSNHIREFNHDGLDASYMEAILYLKAHNDALLFATRNRHLIGKRILELLGSQAKLIFDYHHNFVEPFMLDGQQGWLHRKGASPCSGGLSIIPGSRGDYSYLVQTIYIPELLASMAHGAGRKWKRSECEGRLSKRYSPKALERTAFGSRIICDNRALLYEEAPEAYKPISEVISALERAGIIKVVAKLSPLVTLKTTGGGKCC